MRPVIVLGCGDPRYAHLQDLPDLPKFQVEAIHHFFQEYKSSESGKSARGLEWSGLSAAAEAEIGQSPDRGLRGLPA